MGTDHSKLKHSSSTRIPDSLPSIKLPGSASFCEGTTTGTTGTERDMNRSRTGSACSRSGQRHPIPAKTRRLIQAEFASYFLPLDSSFREEFEEAVKLLLKKSVANIDFVDEVERLSEDFGRWLVDQRVKGFRADHIAALADAAIHECTHLDSAVHKAHTTTHAFSLFATLIFAAVREGFYVEVRRKRRTSTSFSNGSNSSSRKKKISMDSTYDSSSMLKREGSPCSLTPDSRHDSEEVVCAPEGDDGFLKPPGTTSSLLTTNSS